MVIESHCCRMMEGLEFVCREMEGAGTEIGWLCTRRRAETNSLIHRTFVAFCDFAGVWVRDRYFVKLRDNHCCSLSVVRSLCEARQFTRFLLSHSSNPCAG